MLRIKALNFIYFLNLRSTYRFANSAFDNRIEIRASLFYKTVL